MSNLKISLFDRLIFGIPWHGLWKAGKIRLKNGTDHDCPPVGVNLPVGSGTPKSGSVVLIKVPGTNPINRSVEEKQNDDIAGIEWRNYALISGGVYGGSAPIFGKEKSKPVILYVSDDGNRWLIKFIYQSGYLYAQAKKFGIISDQPAPDWSALKRFAADEFFSSYYGVPENFGGPAVEFSTIAQNSRGSDFVIGTVVSTTASATYYCRAVTMYRYRISGNLNLNLDNLGLSVSWEMIECPGRLNIHQEQTEIHSGSLLISHTVPARNSSGLFVKNVVVSIQTVVGHVDGNEILYDGLRLSDWETQNQDLVISNHAWKNQSDIDKNNSDEYIKYNDFIPPDAFTSAPTIINNDRKSTYRTDYVCNKFVWANYYNDIISFVKCEFKWSSSARDIYWKYISAFDSISDILVVQSRNEWINYNLNYYSISEFSKKSPHQRSTRNVDFQETTLTYYSGDKKLTSDSKKSVLSDNTQITDYVPASLTIFPVWSYNQEKYIVSGDTENFSLSALQSISNFCNTSYAIRQDNLVNFTIPSIHPSDNVALGAQCYLSIKKSTNGETFDKVFSIGNSEIDITYNIFPFVTYQPVLDLINFDSQRVCFF